MKQLLFSIVILFLPEIYSFKEGSGNEEFLDTFRQNSFPSPDYEEIVQDVGAIDEVNNGGVLGLFSENMFPIVTNGESPVIAGGFYGKGRFIVGGSENYFLSGKSGPGLRNLTRNAVKWLAKANTTDNIVLVVWTIGSVGDLPATQTRVSVKRLDVNVTQVYYIPMRSSFPPEDIEKLKSFVKNGGGLMTAGTFDGWFRVHGEENALECPGNSMIKWFGALMGRSMGSAKNLSDDLDRNYYYALMDANNTNKDVAVQTLINLSGLLLNKNTMKDPLFAGLFTKAANAFNSLDLGSDRASYSRLVKAMLPGVLLTKPDHIRKANDYSSFPGAVPEEAERVRETHIVNGTYIGYPLGFRYAGAGNDLKVSTGLYAPPGEVLKIAIQGDTMTNDDIGVQIGCHTDRLYHKPGAPRSPEISAFFRLSNNETAYVANPWGGSIYILVRHGSGYPVLNVTIDGGVKAPYFVLGKSNVDDWRATIRHYPAPWGELEVPDQFILTVGSSVLRDFDDPRPLLELYKDAMKVYNFMQGFEGDFRFRGERITLDAEISAGLMHSGYSIMGYQKYAKYLIDEKVYREGSLWGPFHEIGHNAQWYQYTTGAVTESGCNVYAYYVFLNVLNITRYPQEVEDADIVEWLLDGRTYYGNQIATLSNIMLLNRYGLGIWRNMSRFYYNHQEEIQGETFDTFAYVMSKVSGLNLCPYYQFFTFVLSERTLEACEALPMMPDKIIDRYDPVLKPSPPPIGECPLGWFQYNSSCFYLQKDVLVNWKNAEAACHQMNPNSHLASCFSSDEAFFLTRHFRSFDIQGIYYVGIDERGPEKEPLYLDGSSLPNLMPWERSFPRKNNNLCVKMEAGFLADIYCGELHGFICKLGPTACGPNDGP